MGINQNSIFYHSSRLIISSIFLQILSFFYRILLGRLAGAQVIAAHSLVMSAYNVVLAVTLSGISFSVSRIAAKYQAIGSGKSVKRLISFSLIIFLSLFSLLALPFGFFREEFAEHILGDAQTSQALFLLIPCLFLTGFENIHKAYFYGSSRTVPPMISETLEMLCRIITALILFSIFPKLNVAATAALIVLGMVFSEIISATFLTLCYKLDKKNMTGKDNISSRQILRDIVNMTLPISISTLISRILHAANTVLIPKTLVISGATLEEAMEQFGTLSGMTIPMLMLPSAFLSPLITVLTPRFTAAHALNKTQEIRRKTAKALHTVGLFGIPSLLFIAVYGEFFAKLLYQNKNAANFIFPMAFNTFLSFWYIVCESVLEGTGQQKRSAILAVVANSFGIILTILFGCVFKMGINGYLIGEISSFLFGVIISAKWVKKFTKLEFRLENWIFKPFFAAGISILFIKPLFIILCREKISEILVFSFCAVLTLLIYTILIRILGVNYPKYLRNLFTKN